MRNEDGYILEWLSSDARIKGDLWFESLHDAIEAASDHWGIPPSDWLDPPQG
jgi:hypothetical protein